MVKYPHLMGQLTQIAHLTVTIHTLIHQIAYLTVTIRTLVHQIVYLTVTISQLANQNETFYCDNPSIGQSK
jgi:hypothetical protein